jgi:hypothetical protein
VFFFGALSLFLHYYTYFFLLSRDILASSENKAKDEI